MKTYIITVAKEFMKGHPNEGQPTGFSFQIWKRWKKHTIRENVDYWKRIIDQVNEGNAKLSVREWTGKPYRSKQNVIKEYFKGQLSYQLIGISEGFGVQIGDKFFYDDVFIKKLAENDGLSINDFKAWFNKVPFRGIIIHFTKLKY